MEMDARGRSFDLNRAVQARRLFRRHRGISAASLGLAILATPALSLSCLRPDVANTFNDLDALPQEYVVLHGSFEGTPAKPVDQKDATAIATFSGEILTPNGFDTIPDARIRVTLTCAGPWCADMQAGADYVAFVENVADGAHLRVGPCYGNLFSTPQEAQLDTLKSCAASGPCKPAK